MKGRGKTEVLIVHQRNYSDLVSFNEIKKMYMCSVFELHASPAE